MYSAYAKGIWADALLAKGSFRDSANKYKRDIINGYKTLFLSIYVRMYGIIGVIECYHVNGFLVGSMVVGLSAGLVIITGGKFVIGLLAGKFGITCFVGFLVITLDGFMLEGMYLGALLGL